MRKLLNKPWVVGLLACCAVGLVAYEGFGLPAGRASTGDGAATEATEGDQPSEVRSENISTALTATEMFVAPGSRDPFAARIASAAPAAANEVNASAAPTTATLKLAAVWLQGEESFVAINSKICRVGELVAGAAIESVTREGAWLRLPSGRQFLPVGREVTFVPPEISGASVQLVVTREH